MRPGSPTMSPWSPGPRPASLTASRCTPPSWSSLSPLQATSLVGPHLDLPIKFTPSAPEVFKEDGSPWFTLFLATQSRNYKTMSETMRLYYINPETGRNEQETFLGTVIPIVPKSWWMIFFTLAKTDVPLAGNNIRIPNFVKICISRGLRGLSIILLRYAKTLNNIMYFGFLRSNENGKRY